MGLRTQSYCHEPKITRRDINLFLVDHNIVASDQNYHSIVNRTKKRKEPAIDTLNPSASLWRKSSTDSPRILETRDSIRRSVDADSLRIVP